LPLHHRSISDNVAFDWLNRGYMQNAISDEWLDVPLAMQFSSSAVSKKTKNPACRHYRSVQSEEVVNALHYRCYAAIYLPHLVFLVRRNSKKP